MVKKYKDFIEKYPNTWIVVIAISWVALVSIAWVVTYYKLKDDAPDVRGTFGDMFGSVNALFSGLALAGIVISILLQRKELGYQRDELRATRLEFEIQNKTLKNQRFENTFFNLLSLHHQIVDSIDFEYEDLKGLNSMTAFLDKNRVKQYTTLKGRDVFKYKYEKLYDNLRECENENEEQTIYDLHYSQSQTDFGHYFRNLYRIIKFIDKTVFVTFNEFEGYNKFGATDKIVKLHERLNYKARYEYVAIVRSQISDYELLWLFYNCLNSNGIDKFKPLIERYTFFKNLPVDRLHNPKLVDSYEERARIKIF